MKDLQQFAGKRMPYKEDSDYVSSLLDRCADKALAAKGGRGGRGAARARINRDGVLTEIAPGHFVLRKEDLE